MRLNGKDFPLQAEKPLLQLLKELELNPSTVAIEYNGDILNRELWESTYLQNSDKIEIIKFVGGG